MDSHLDPRARQILHSLVVHYLRDGNPVGSRTLSHNGRIHCSPATIRNVMADLEDLGLLVSPHTSAGRIPSARGMRFFIDQLLTVTPPTQRVIRDLREGLRGDTPAEVLRGMATVISQLTAYVGFVTLPATGAPTIRHLRFVQLSSSRALAIMVTGEGEVINRIVTCDDGLSEARLKMAARAYNSHFSGLTLAAAQQRLHEQIVDVKDQIASLLRGLLSSVGGENEGEQLQVAGVANLLNQEDLSSNIKNLRQLYDLLEKKKDLLEIVRRSSGVENVGVFIGSESGVQALEACSIVFSSCINDGEGGKPLGMVGVIGPKRMRYSRVIPTVDVASKLLGDVLGEMRARLA